MVLILPPTRSEEGRKRPRLQRATKLQEHIIPIEATASLFDFETLRQTLFTWIYRSFKHTPIQTITS